MRAGDIVASRFVIERLAGTGGMGAVYRALDQATGQPVALKVIHASADAEEYAARLTREGEALARLSHPHVVRYVSHGLLPGGEPYVVLEWVEGEALRKRLSDPGLTLTESLAVVTQVADALGYAHARGIIHRDVKPGNVMLRAGEGVHAVLLDFGVARVSFDSGELTQTGMWVGTPLYMAPEQARATRDVDARADVFALGCLLFRCLTGKAAFQADDALAVFTKVLFDDAPRVRDVAPSLPPELDAIVARMLERERERRYANGAEVADALRTLTLSSRGELVPARVSSPSLTFAEQRLTALVVVGGTNRTDDARLAAVRHATAGLPVHCEALANGCIVLVSSQARGASATDLALGAARAALRVRAALPDAPLVVVTGRGTPAGGTTVGAGGDVFNRASRTLRLTESSRILLDDATARLLDGRFDVRSGPAGPELQGELAAAEPVRTLLGKATPCVGRERELGLLAATLTECVSDGVARAVVVTAPSGTGKSRLRYELLRLAKEKHPDALVLLGRGDPWLTGGPYAILGQAMRRASGLAMVGKHLPAADRARITVFLGEMIGVPVPDSALLQAARRDPALMASQTRRAFEEWLTAECRVRPVVLVLDDLQWGDAATTRLIDGALGALAEQPLFVLALGRPELLTSFPGLWSSLGAQPLPLGPLSRKASEKLAREVLGSAVAADTIERVVRLAAGNAFYLEELLRSTSAGETDVPDSVRAMVQARLEALEPDARRILRAAAVFGETFSLGGVRALVGDGVVAVAPWLETLTGRELLTARGDGQYTFRHAMLREAAYAMLTEEDARLGHRLAATWLVETGERDALALAEHFERGDDPALASPWLVRAAERAIENNEFAQALSIAARGEAVGAPPADRGALMALQAEAYRWRGESERSQRTAREAVALLQRSDRQWVRAVNLLALMSGIRCDYDELERTAELLLDHIARSDEATGRASVLASADTAGALSIAGRAASAKRLLDATERLAAPTMDTDPNVAARVHSARRFRALAEADHQALLDTTMASRNASRLAGDDRTAGLMNVNVGYTFGLLGRWEEAEATLREALADATAGGFATTSMAARQNLGWVLFRRGRLQEADAMEQQVAVDATTQGAVRFLVSARTCLSGIALAMGDAARAVREARAALDVGDDSAPFRVFALATLAEAQLAAGDARAAAESAEDAVRRAEHAGFLPAEAFVRIVHAEALLRSGQTERGREALEAARAALESRAARVPAGHQRERFLTDVPEHARTLRLSAEWAR